MTVKEMHIGVNELLQKVNSNFTDDFEPPQIDWALNREVIKFIKQRISPKSNDKKEGFQDNQKRFDDLKPLLSSVILPAYVNNDNSVFTYFNSDYFSLVSDRTTTKNLCGGNFSNVATQSFNYNLVCFPINNDDTNLYAGFTISINGIVKYNIANYPTLLAELTSSEAKFVLINHIIEVLNDTVVYQCKYKSFYGLKGEGIVLYMPFNNGGVDIHYNSGTIHYNPIEYVQTKITNVSGTKEYLNRLTGTEKLFSVLGNSIGGTEHYSPISTIEEDRLIVYHNKKFIPTFINVTYIKKPKKISLPLNQSSELDESSQEEIIDNTAKTLAGLTSSQVYQNMINENLGKE